MKHTRLTLKNKRAPLGLFVILTISLTCLKSTNIFAAQKYAATSAVAPTGTASFCAGSTVTGTYSDVVTICSSTGNRSPQTVTYNWKLDGVTIPGATGTFAPTTTEYTVTATPDLSLAAAGTHTLTVTYNNSVANCGSTTAFNSAKLILTVNPLPDPIGGMSKVCTGASITLTDATTGGTWSTASVSANVDGSGIVTGISAGTADIVYALATGCSVMKRITINQSPANIVSAPMVCANASALATNTVAGGIWQSSNTSVLSINPGTGLMSGISAGVVSISYTMTGGCYKTKAVRVFPAPAPITGSSMVCPGANIMLADATNGGVWSMAPNPNILLNGLTGMISGISAGTVPVTYSLPTGCATSLFVTVLAGPSPITSPAEICMTTTAICTDITLGGLWATNDIAVGSIDGSGILAGVAVGSGIISYTISNGCFVTMPYTVTAFPDPIGGPGIVCVGNSITLTEAVSGGSWSGATPSGFVDIAGTFTGFSAGITTVSYTMPAGCYVTTDITVNVVPMTILSPMTLPPGRTFTCSDLVTGGTWSSSDPSVASIDFINGLVTGESAGYAIISYTLVTGCYATRPIAITSSGFRHATGNTTQPGTNNLTISPNPNNGVFTIAGLINVKENEAATLEITDMRGSIVYTAKIVPVKGSLNEQIRLSNTIASGMYMLRLRTSNENIVYKINVAR
jgi:trimeric autotransporter adhesin